MSPESKPVRVDPARIAEIRAAWRADREERWDDFCRHWPADLLELAREASWGLFLGVVLGLLIVIWALEELS